MNGPQTYKEAVEAELDRQFGITLNDTNITDGELSRCANASSPSELVAAYGETYRLVGYVWYLRDTCS